MKFYDIEDSIIEKDGYILKFTNKGEVGKGPLKNRFTCNTPDNDAQIKANLDTMIRIMESKGDVHGELMVTCTRVGEPLKALQIEIAKKSAEKIEEKSEVPPARRGRKPANQEEESDGKDR